MKKLEKRVVMIQLDIHRGDRKGQNRGYTREVQQLESKKLRMEFQQEFSALRELEEGVTGVSKPGK